MKNNNQRLRINLHKLQVETNKRLDRIEMKEKNELYEKEKEKKQSSLDQLLQVKEREIVNSIQIVEKKKKRMKNLEMNTKKENEEYDECKTIKDKIDKIRKISLKIYTLEEEKKEYANKNDFDKAKELKNEKEKKDYKNAERAAVILRRLEYTHGLGEKINKEDKIIFYLMKGAALIIEDWWIKIVSSSNSSIL